MESDAKEERSATQIKERERLDAKVKARDGKVVQTLDQVLESRRKAMVDDDEGWEYDEDELERLSTKPAELDPQKQFEINRQKRLKEQKAPTEDSKGPGQSLPGGQSDSKASGQTVSVAGMQKTAFRPTPPVPRPAVGKGSVEEEIRRRAGNTNEFKAQIAQLEKELEKLKDDRFNVGEDLKRALGEKKVLQEALNKAGEVRRDLQDGLEDAKTAARQTDTERGKMQGELDRANSQWFEAQTKVEELSAELKRLRNAKRSTGVVSGDDKDHQSEIEKKKVELDTLETELGKTQYELVSRDFDLRDLQAKIEQLEVEMEIKSKALDDLRARQLAIQKQLLADELVQEEKTLQARQELERTEKLLRTEKTLLDTTSSQVSVARQTLRSLIDTSAGEQKILESKRDELASISFMLKTKEERLGDAEAQILALIPKQRDLDATKDKLIVAENKLRDTNASLEVVQGTLESKTNQLAAREDQLKIVETSLGGQQRMLSMVKSEYDEILRELDKAKEELAQRQSDLEDRQSQLDLLETSSLTSDSTEGEHKDDVQESGIEGDDAVDETGEEEAEAGEGGEGDEDERAETLKEEIRRLEGEKAVLMARVETAGQRLGEISRALLEREAREEEMAILYTSLRDGVDKMQNAYAAADETSKARTAKMVLQSLADAAAKDPMFFSQVLRNIDGQ